MDNLSPLMIDQSQVQILAKNLRRLLDARGISELDIAQSLDIPVMTVRRIVSGETADPRISTLKTIAGYFGVSIDSLLDDNDKKPLTFMTRKMPQFVPILDWKTAGNITSLKDISVNKWKEWQPVFLSDDTTLRENAFALESRPSMQPRFPIGTLFIIDPNEPPADGDFVLIKMIGNAELSLRELIIDPPKWQLQPVVSGSEVLFYDQTKHSIVGVVILSMLDARKEK